MKRRWLVPLSLPILLASACATTARHQASVPDPDRTAGTTRIGFPADPDGDIPDKPVITWPAPSGSVLDATGGSNVRVNPSDNSHRDQNEMTITISPANSNVMVGGANDARLGHWGAGWYSSQDGGKTWTDGVMQFQKYANQGDPTVASCGDGTIVYGYLDYNGAYQPSRFIVTRSTDGGLTWLTPGTVQETGTGFPFADKPYIACAPTGGTSANRSYVSWTNFGTTTSPIRFAYSTNYGQTWTGAKNLSVSGGVQGSIPVAGKNGVVYVFWAGPTGIEFAKSSDGGVTFAPWKTAAGIVGISDTNFRRPTFPTAAIDNSGGPYDGYVYTAWHDQRSGDPDIYLSRSTDGGTTWSAPSRVNSDDAGNGRDQFFPWIAVDEKGVVHLAWIDRRFDANNQKQWVVASSSHDGGVTWDTNQVLSDVLSNGSLTGFLGDYSALAARNGKLVPLWSDLRLGTGEEEPYITVEPTFQYDDVAHVRIGQDKQTLSFDNQSPRLGTGIVYDVQRGEVSDLANPNRAQLATCAAENSGSTSIVLPGSPLAAHAWYYLVRSQGPRGIGSFGSGTAHPDPRDGFDDTPVCGN